MLWFYHLHCFMPGLVEIDRMVLEKKIFIFPQCKFSQLSPLRKKVWPFIWRNLNSLHPRMLCAKFGWNWPGGSGEEDENVKSDNENNNDNDDEQQTNCDQKNSLEHLTQMSLKISFCPTYPTHGFKIALIHVSTCILLHVLLKGCTLRYIQSRSNI